MFDKILATHFLQFLLKFELFPVVSELFDTLETRQLTCQLILPWSKKNYGIFSFIRKSQVYNVPGYDILHYHYYGIISKTGSHQKPHQCFVFKLAAADPVCKVCLMRGSKLFILLSAPTLLRICH